MWDDVRVFLSVHRLGSHKRAARPLGVNATTVGRRISALEQALGVRLFARTPEGLQSTPAGLGLVSHAERMELEALELQRQLAGADRRLEGLLRVSASDGLLHHVLLPALAEFRRAHPALSLELRSEPRVVDLSRREADVALRCCGRRSRRWSLGGSGSCSWRCLPVANICSRAACRAVWWRSRGTIGSASMPRWTSCRR